MKTVKDLKRLLNLMPDDALLTVEGYQGVGIEGVTVEASDTVRVDLHITPGYSITKDSMLADLYNQLRPKGVEFR